MSIARIRPKKVYHYCSLETFFSIFSNSTIRLSNISKSNDTEEITYLLPKITRFCTNLFNNYNAELPDDYKLQSVFVSNAFDNKFNETSLNFEESDLYHQIEKYTVEKIERSFTGNAQHDSLMLLNIIDTTISMILYNSILHKNPNFYEEKEWRLVYNPFGNIRKVKDKFSYYDRMHEMFNKFNEKGGLTRTPMTFHISNDKIISHIDLSFESIKKSFIKEIIIGSKANIDDLDLDLFLLSNGYNPKDIFIHKSNIPYR